MTKGTSSDLGSVCEWLFSQLPPYQLPPPWDFVTPDSACRGTIRDPDGLLRAAREQCSDEALLKSGVLRQRPGCGLQVNPALCNPVGAIIALRESEIQPPYELLTARGCMSGAKGPLFAIRGDAWTEAHLVGEGDEMGVVYLTPRICEVVLLRALGRAAPLSLGMHRLTWDEIQILAPPEGEKGSDDLAATPWRQPARLNTEDPIDVPDAGDPESATDDEPGIAEGKFISLADIEWKLLTWQPSTLI